MILITSPHQRAKTLGNKMTMTEANQLCTNCGCTNPQKTYDGYWCKICKNEMKTTHPPLRSQSWAIWQQTIQDELAATRDHIASLEVTTALWRNNNPRPERCSRSWAASS